LGVDRIQPVESSRVEKGLIEASRKRRPRWERIARESSQQSRRVRAPEILTAASFSRVLAQDAEYRYFLEESAAAPLLGILPASRLSSDRVALLAGPEGGWTDAERQAAVSAGWLSASLSPLILRAETAAIAGVAAIVNAWM
jgi:16S rRNA (uracil1498-N3)-methyltransferase